MSAATALAVMILCRDYGKLWSHWFEPLDVLQSVYMIVKQIIEGRAEVENQHYRVVERDGIAWRLRPAEAFCATRLFPEWR